MGNFKKLVREEEGQGLVEYALIVALIAVVAITAVRMMGNSITNLFTNTATTLDTSLN